MFAIISLCLLLFIHLTTSFSSDWSTEFTYATYIDQDQLFKLYWTNLGNDIIEFGIEVEATGWIALGISPLGTMPNSDIYIGWVDSDGNTIIQDRYTEDRSAPLYDNQQNLTLIEGEEVDGMTRLRFQRPKYSCDSNDLSLSQGTTRLIWAFHESQDPESECFDSSSIAKHTNKGSQSINLDSGIPAEIELEDDVEIIDILMSNISIPTTDPFYCKLFELPVFNETQYAIKFEPVIPEENQGLVTHIVAYYCPIHIANQTHNVTENTCDGSYNRFYDDHMPSLECQQSPILYIWTVGGNDLYMPDVAGIPLSGDSDLYYILLQVHYDNPLEESGLTDSSGFRMYHTATERTYDAGLLQIGLYPSFTGQYIPQGLEHAHNAAFMPSECTIADSAGIPDDGIKIFAFLLHQHSIGTASRFRHIRNGTELPYIDYNFNYDYNYQQVTYFKEPIVLLPGDEFILDCWTNSSLRTDYTEGGDEATDENCVVYLYYYPKVPLRGSFVQKYLFSSIGNWIMDAYDEGYFDANDTEFYNFFRFVSWDILSKYNGSAEGALEFYNRLWSVDYPEYNEHTIWCEDWNGNDIFADDQYARNESFEQYELQDISCNNTEDNTYDTMEGECVPLFTRNPTTSIPTINPTTSSPTTSISSTQDVTSNSHSVNTDMITVFVLIFYALIFC